MSDIDRYKWLWNATYDSEHRSKIIEGAISAGDIEALKWFWNATYDSGHKSKIIEGAASTGDIEALKWFWNATYDSEHRSKIIEGAISAGDIEALKWFWNATYDSEHRSKIIEGAISAGDIEALKWFWNATYDPEYRNKLVTAMLPKKERTNSNINQRIRTIASNSNKYDLFICHASEDKSPFVRELAQRLTRSGLNVWYDEFTLSLGDNLRRSIDNGLANCRYGVVVLSPNFFKKEWPQKELDGLVAKEYGLNKVILPVWHNITRDEVRTYSPILADRLAASSSQGLDYVVGEIIKVVKKTSKTT